MSTKNTISHPGKKGFIQSMLAASVLFLCIAASPDFSNASDATPGKKTDGGRHADNKHTGVSPERGVTHTQEVPFVRETLRDMKKRIPWKPEIVQKQRTIPFNKRPPPVRLDKKGVAFPEADAPDKVHHKAVTPSQAPSVFNNFSGLGDNNTAIPPDTHGAAGDSYLVETLNSEVAFFDKATGSVIAQMPMQDFWASLGTNTAQPAEIPFDPKTIYDQHKGRFIVVSMGGMSSPYSWVLLAVSGSSDPTGVWYKWAIDADKDGGVQTFNNWADFPGIGVDADYVYITANMFNDAGDFQYGKVWVIPKDQLLSGTSSISITEFRNPPGSGFTMQPAHVFGTTSAEYLIDEGHYINGPPLRSFFNVNSITFPDGVPTWSNLGLVEVNPYPVSDVLPGAPQSGIAAQINTNDTRLLNAVFRNGYIWTTHTVANDTNTKTEVAWYQINPASASLSSPHGVPVQQGRVSSTNRWYYFPSLAVNADGDAGIGFSGSSLQEYAGAYYTMRKSSDGAGQMQEVSTLKAGLAPYYKVFDGADNRWGDYSATCVDPGDDYTFWTLQEYASYPAGGYDRWGTWWGKFAVADVVPTQEPTVSPTPTSTPTPPVCTADLLTIFPKGLELTKKQSSEVIVTVTGIDGCPVENETVQAVVGDRGKKYLKVAPESVVTNTEGKGVFSITAKRKTGRVRINFEVNGQVKKGFMVKIR